MNAIQVENITKTFPGKRSPAVKEISLALEKGKILTILGPSGCGKTTILRLIAGFEKPDRGRIILAGKAVADDTVWVPPEKRGVGMVFQDYALFPHLNVYHNIGFGYRGKDRKERIAEVLELVKLSGFENREPHELSGGQRQRVALARALARRPVLVMLDEPFNSLDAELRGRMRLEIARIIKESGTTAVFVSHDQKDALAISDQVMVIRDGLSQQCGSPQEVYRFPENSFVANFVGQSNIMSGVIGEDGRSVETGLGVIPCEHLHDCRPGEKVEVSIRPDSLELDERGPLLGRITCLVYTGESYEARVDFVGEGGDRMSLLAHVHPERTVKLGDMVRMKLLPEFVAVLGCRPATCQVPRSAGTGRGAAD